MLAKRIPKCKQYTTVGIIIIFSLVLAGCLEYETTIITIYRYPNGNAKVTMQFSGIKSGGRWLEEDYQTLMDIVDEKNWTTNDFKLNYIKIWINDDGFLEGLMAAEGSEKQIFEVGNFIVKEDYIVTVLDKEATHEKNYKTNGEKILKDDDLIIRWSIQTRILQLSENDPYAKDTNNRLADLFKKRNPKGIVEKHFD